jgi:hypothetical protein
MRGRANVEEKLMESRNGPMTLWPKHVTHWVSIDLVDKDQADTLAQIRADEGDPP